MNKNENERERDKRSSFRYKINKNSIEHRHKAQKFLYEMKQIKNKNGLSFNKNEY